jgi:hypothetical protein
VPFSTENSTLAGQASVLSSPHADASVTRGDSSLRESDVGSRMLAHDALPGSLPVDNHPFPQMQLPPVTRAFERPGGRNSGTATRTRPSPSSSGTPLSPLRHGIPELADDSDQDAADEEGEPVDGSSESSHNSTPQYANALAHPPVTVVTQQGDEHATELSSLYASVGVGRG